MNVSSSLTQNVLLRILNSERLDRERYEYCRQRMSPSLQNLARPASPESWPTFEHIVASRLRELVDDWIATGIDADGSESFAQRRLTAAHIARKAITGSKMRNELELGIDSAGELTICVVAKRGEEVFGDSNYFRAAFREADALFTAMMAVDWKRRLFRCRRSNCGRYFIAEKLLRRPYRHGVFCCPEHRRHESAENCTNIRRERAKSALVEYAVEWLLNLNQRLGRQPWRENQEIKKALAGALSVKIHQVPNLRAVGDIVGVKWVTRHAGDIEKCRIERMKARR